MTLVLFAMVVIAGAAAIFQWTTLTRAARAAAEDLQGDRGRAAVEELTAEIVGACMQRRSASKQSSSPERGSSRRAVSDEAWQDEERSYRPRDPRDQYEREGEWDEPAPRVRRRPDVRDDLYAETSEAAYAEERPRRRQRVDDSYDEVEKERPRRSRAAREEEDDFDLDDGPRGRDHW